MTVVGDWMLGGGFADRFPKIWEEDQGMTHFDGLTYRAELDRQRLSTQMKRVRWLLQHHRTRWWTLGELSQVIGGSEAGISARLRDMRKKRFGSCVIERRRRGDPKAGLHEYRMRPDLSAKEIV